MMLIKYKDSLIRYFMYLFSLFLALFIVVNLIGDIKNDDLSVRTSVIQYSSDLYDIYVEYPRFANNEINNIITDSIYSYVKDFKYNSDEDRLLNINYNLYYFEDYVNIVFYIENTLNNIKNKNLLINLKENKLDYITSVYDVNYLTSEINDLVYYKYSIDIFNKVKESTVNNFTYIINEDEIYVYFNNIDFGLDYIPYVVIQINKNVNYNDDLEYDDDKKYIAFTYDDGPSQYTEELLKTLELNNSSATFFMLGNRMKEYSDLILNIYSSNSEIGSHSYSHKDLSSLSVNELYNEVNSTNIIFNSITGDNLKYLRPPYNYYNNDVINLNYEIILWNIDTKDWLVKDSKKIYNDVISSACDGCIVLMHDIYKESIEATKMLLPKLDEMGYEVVSISKLAEIKGYDFSVDDVTNFIRD